MRRFLLLAALCSSAGLAQAQVTGNGLLDVYREALDNNADLAAELLPIITIEYPMTNATTMLASLDNLKA